MVVAVLSAAVLGVLISAPAGYAVDGEDELWTRQFGSAGDDYAESIAGTGTGAYTAGYTSGTLPGQVSAGGSDVFVRQYDNSGNAMWTSQFGTAGEDVSHGVGVDASGFYVTGRVSGALPGQSHSSESPTWFFVSTRWTSSTGLRIDTTRWSTTSENSQ